MDDIMGVLGEVVYSPYDFGVIIDIDSNEYQVSHKDGKDIYYKFEDLKFVNHSEKKELLKDKKFKKHYNDIIKQLYDQM
jgi:hypothetical protein